jgi:hypothetical protein
LSASRCRSSQLEQTHHRGGGWLKWATQPAVALQRSGVEHCVACAPCGVKRADPLMTRRAIIADHRGRP